MIKRLFSQFGIMLESNEKALTIDPDITAHTGLFLCYPADINITSRFLLYNLKWFVLNINKRIVDC